MIAGTDWSTATVIEYYHGVSASSFFSTLKEVSFGFHVIGGVVEMRFYPCCVNHTKTLTGSYFRLFILKKGENNFRRKSSDKLQKVKVAVFSARH